MGTSEKSKRRARGSRPVDVVIDTPRGSRCKFKLDDSTGRLQLGKLLPRGATFPSNFGFIPSTIAEDGDALDVLVLVDEALPVGCHVSVRIIGVLEAKQSERGRKAIRNDRLIGVIETEHNPPEMRSIHELSAQQRRELVHFFSSYNLIEGRRFRSLGWKDADQALGLIEQARRRATA